MSVLITALDLSSLKRNDAFKCLSAESGPRESQMISNTTIWKIIMIQIYPACSAFWNLETRIIHLLDDKISYLDVSST